MTDEEYDKMLDTISWEWESEHEGHCYVCHVANFDCGEHCEENQ